MNYSKDQVGMEPNLEKCSVEGVDSVNGEEMAMADPVDYNPETDAKYSDALYVQIIKSYLDTESVKETAQELHTTPVKVRKVLITEGLWSSKTSLEVQHYLNLGKTTAEIAEILSTTEKAVQQYLPYTKGIYKGDNPSVGALNTAEYRERIRVAQENTLRQSLNIAIKNQWYEMYETSEIKRAREVAELMGFEPSDPNDYFFPGELRIPEGTDDSKFKYPLSLDPIRLHLELVLPRVEHIIGLVNDEEFERIRKKEYEAVVETLKKYGEVKYGETISRDIIVPGRMQLWALNYAIQKCFGWQNSHLHCFELPEDQFRKICDVDCGKFLELLGVALRSPWMGEEEEFWADDYEDGSFKTWLRKKYTGPYESMCHGEGIWQCKQDAKEIRKRYKYVSLKHTVGESGYKHYSWPEPITKKKYDEMKKRGPIEKKVVDGFRNGEIEIHEVFTWDEMPFEALNWISERGVNQVLERLSVSEVFAIRDKGIDDAFFEGDRVPETFAEVMDEDVIDDVERYQNVDYPDAQPYMGSLTDELFYSYDFGDGWKVRITASFGAADLIESGRVTQDELDAAVIQMYETWRPVCIAQDGMNVLDDVGGVHGYVQFLRGISEKKSKEDEYSDWSDEYGLYANKKESLAWAKSLGWSKRKISNKNVL